MTDLHLTLHYIIIVIMQTYLKILNFQTACQVYSVECVSKIKSILAIIFHAIYGVVCKQRTRVSYDDCENTCTLSNHPQIGGTV